MIQGVRKIQNGSFFQSLVSAMMSTSESVHDERFKSLCETLSLTASAYCSGMKVIFALFVAVDDGVWAPSSFS